MSQENAESDAPRHRARLATSHGANHFTSPRAPAEQESVLGKLLSIHRRSPAHLRVALSSVHAISI
jgi:hypothetical protein